MAELQFRDTAAIRMSALAAWWGRLQRNYHAFCAIANERGARRHPVGSRQRQHRLYRADRHRQKLEVIRRGKAGEAA
jgi:hypothetical protein